MAKMTAAEAAIHVLKKEGVGGEQNPAVTLTIEQGALVFLKGGGRSGESDKVRDTLLIQTHDGVAFGSVVGFIVGLAV